MIISHQKSYDWSHKRIISSKSDSGDVSSDQSLEPTAGRTPITESSSKNTISFSPDSDTLKTILFLIGAYPLGVALVLTPWSGRTS